MNGTELRAARKGMCVTVERFAEMFGVKPGTVQAWESGKWPNGNESVVPERVVSWFERPYDIKEAWGLAVKLCRVTHELIGAEPPIFKDMQINEQSAWFEQAILALARVTHKREPK